MHIYNWKVEMEGEKGVTVVLWKINVIQIREKRVPSKVRRGA